MNQPRPFEDSASAAAVPARTTGQRICVAAAGLLLLCGGLALVLSCCWRREAPPPPPPPPLPPLALLPDEEPRVRMRLASGAQRLHVACTAGGCWSDPLQQQWQRPVEAGSWELCSQGALLQLGEEPPVGSAALFTPDDGLFRLEGRQYRGSLSVEVGDEGLLSATEVVALEQYLRGVVPSEMPTRWPLQALMAQAVAARTFALHRMTDPEAKRSYLTHIDMAYGGVSAESARTDEAIRLTSGLVMWYGGAPVPAYFHSTCGGHTSPAEAVFGEEAIPPLRGVECRWCGESPRYRWRTRIEVSELQRRLSALGVGPLRSIRTVGAVAGGRSKQLLLNGTRLVSAEHFRRVVGRDRIRSTAFAAVRRGSEFEFVGRGWGHGVGLCQWGACGMAREGESWREILAHYYPGSQVTDLRQPPGSGQ